MMGLSMSNLRETLPKGIYAYGLRHSFEILPHLFVPWDLTMEQDRHILSRKVLFHSKPNLIALARSRRIDMDFGQRMLSVTIRSPIRDGYCARHVEVMVRHLRMIQNEIHGGLLCGARESVME